MWSAPVVAEAGFVDTNGRSIVIHVDDRDGRPRCRAGMFAPVSVDVEVPRSLFVVWMPSFDLVRTTSPSTIRIDGEDVAPHRIPFERLHRQRAIMNTGELVAVAANTNATAAPDDHQRTAGLDEPGPLTKPAYRVRATSCSAPAPTTR